MNRPLRILIVDDDALVRAGLKMMLDGADGISVSEASDGEEVPAAVDKNDPSVVLMDIRMPRMNGIAALRRLRERDRSPKVIMLTTFDTDEHIMQALRAGADGFLLKDTPPREIVEAIVRVARGESILSPTVTRRLMDKVADGASTYERASEAIASLSPREREVVVAIGRGLSNAEIAAELYLSIATIKAHVSHILTRLTLDNRTQLALLAHDAELL
ncbi:LuxR family two component transcriptional regulator [Antricoccus suffuscus]|uniref:LuxR family two component transcriptional regulator n=1 Tax=Antricoccus suffuscus TaxID=1629062 RepID=A0A2T0ZZM8_9ACTN|nr:response regulator transcription factor [Antricoccus suffuscus]PRZ41548.1 LuxR family two component transcriptional regulator [Antricoccus suffuscus]